MATASAHELRDLALTLSRLAYSRRIVLKQGQNAADAEEEAQPAMDVTAGRTRGQALAKSLASPAS